MPRRMYASHGRVLNNSYRYYWLSQAEANKQIDTLGGQVTPTAESVSVPYSNPMSDVQPVGRYYRCPNRSFSTSYAYLSSKCGIILTK